MRTKLLTLAALLIGGFSCGATTLPRAEPKPQQPRKPDGDELGDTNSALAKLLREQLLKKLPQPLHQSSRNWDHQKEVVSGLKWNKLKPTMHKSLKNDGLWHRLTLEAIEPDKTLGVGLLDVKTPENGRTTFVAMIGLDARATAEQQFWKLGVRLYGGETKARFRAAARLDCELTSRLERSPGQLVPDAVVRVKVTKTQVFYDNLVVEKTAGLEGDEARRVGELAYNLLKLFKPELEARLLEKANAAILQGGDTKEIRVEFQKLLGLVKP